MSRLCFRSISVLCLQRNSGCQKRKPSIVHNFYYSPNDTFLTSPLRLSVSSHGNPTITIWAAILESRKVPSSLIPPITCTREWPTIYWMVRYKSTSQKALISSGSCYVQESSTQDCVFSVPGSRQNSWQARRLTKVLKCWSPASNFIREQQRNDLQHSAFTNEQSPTIRSRYFSQYSDSCVAGAVSPLRTHPPLYPTLARGAAVASIWTHVASGCAS